MPSSLANAAGPHTLSVTRPGADLLPGGAAVTQLMGPLLLVPQSSPDASLGTVSEVQPSQAHELCGRPLDWIEIVKPR